jgi:hypothetical protein
MQRCFSLTVTAGRDTSHDRKSSKIWYKHSGRGAGDPDIVGRLSCEYEKAEKSENGWKTVKGGRVWRLCRMGLVGWFLKVRRLGLGLG